MSVPGYSRKDRQSRYKELPTVVSDPVANVEMAELTGPIADAELARYARAIGDSARVFILRLLLKHGTRSCAEITREYEVATVMEHLRVLRNAGLVVSSRDGRENRYRVNPAALHRFKVLIAIL